MYPILLNLGKLTIYTYGFFIALSFLIGISFAKHEAKNLGVDQEKIMDIFFYIIISGIIGARVFYVAINVKTFSADPMEFFRIWNGGLVFYGGFIFALITAYVFIKKNGMPLGKTVDIAGPTLALGHSIARIGCFFAGCCYGKQCELPWAVTFTHPKSLAPIGVPLHPTQLYESLNLFVIFVILFLLRRHKKFEGQLFWTYILLYGTTRSLIELFRGDFRGGFVFGIFSVSQTIGLFMSFSAIFMLVYLYRRTRNSKGKNARDKL